MTRKTAQATEIDVYARDLRMIRASGQVANRYQILRRSASTGNQVFFDIRGGTSPYVVAINPAWKERPACTCPDAARRALEQNGGFCKHIIAVLLQEPEFKCQLLELFL